MAKSIIAALSLLTIAAPAQAQVKVDTTIKLDLLQAPVNPAFNILGISNTDIERPTDLTSFSASLQQASNNFTSFPNSYAAQVAPFLLRKDKYSLADFRGQKNAVPQSFLVSFGFTHQGPKGQENVDSLKTTKLGLGLKVSLIRPKWSERTSALFDTLIQRQQRLKNVYTSVFERMSGLLWKKQDSLSALERQGNLSDVERATFQRLAVEISTLTTQLHNAAVQAADSSAAFQSLKNAAAGFKSERIGFAVDLNSGFAMNFRQNNFDDAQLYRGGVWITAGYEGGNKGISALGLLRYLYHPDTAFAGKVPNGIQYSTFDAGGKLLVPAMEGKFVFNVEAIYRSVLKKNVLDPSWRVVLNTEYDLGLNKKLTFAFGRDFDGTVTKGGNLVAAINFIAGFGSERKISK